MSEGMKKIRWQLGIGFPGAKREGELEVEDYATDEDIDELVWDQACQIIETNWEVIE